MKIAIVGIGCRLPGGVSSPDELVEFLDNNGDAVVEVPPDRWDIGRFYSPDEDAPGRAYVKHAAFLKRDVFAFDPAPFALSPREAEALDPQQRLLLEASWDAIDDANIPLHSLRGSATGVYIGAFMLDIRDISTQPQNLGLVGGQTAAGVSTTVLSNRLSYTFDLRGPSLSVDTACSSSLVAVHLACRDLIEGSCSLAIAGGTNVMLSPASTIVMSKGKFLARDGRSKSFDAAADGYGRGEGACLVILKRLDDAVRDGDRIYATILATGINQDGRTDGMPMPSEDAQLELARRVAKQAAIDPARLGYVEAHGTGTPAGDPIELGALAGAYSGNARTSPLAVGSIKSNLGHLEAAAGVVGLVKAALSLHHSKVFPLRALGQPNPHIPFEAYKIRIPLRTESWPVDLDRTAAVNSFGYGGTNAHAVLGAAPPLAAMPCEPTATGEALLLPISAFDEGALRQRARDYEGLAGENLPALASTLAHHRAHLPVRATIALGTPHETLDALHALSTGALHPRVQRGREGEVSKLLWVYTGMGPQWWAMGRQLLMTEGVFRELAQEIDATFLRLSGWSILEELLKPESESQMASNRVAQPANFIIQAGLTQVLREHGLKADGYLGHSVGELAAAWASGCLSLQDATYAAYQRSRLQDQAAGQGAMLAVTLSLNEALDYCQKYSGIDIAAINSLTSIVLSGQRDSLVQVQAELKAHEVFAKFMRVEVAYHSQQMEPLKEGFFSHLGQLTPKAPTSPLYSTAYGERIARAAHDAAYWWQNAREKVQLKQALELALSDGYDGFLEIGPHPVLAAAISENARSSGKSVRVFSTLRRGEQDDVQVTGALGNLYCAGVSLDWTALVSRTAPCKLPRYPFQLKPYWRETAAAAQYRKGRPGSPALVDQWNEAAQTWTTELDDARFPWLSGHRVLGALVFPGAGYVDLALSAAAQAWGSRDEYVVFDMSFHSALVLPEAGFSTLSATLQGETLTISASTEEVIKQVASARLPSRSRYLPLGTSLLSQLIEGMTETDVEGLYSQFVGLGLNYSGEFRAIKRAWIARYEACAELLHPTDSRHMIYPATLDGAFQLLLACLPNRPETALIPVRAAVVRWLAPVVDECFCHVSVKMTGRGASANVRIFDGKGKICLAITGLECEPAERRTGLRTKEEAWFHGQSWVPARLIDEPSSSIPLTLVSGDSSLCEMVRAYQAKHGVPVLDVIAESGPVHVVLSGQRTADPIGGEDLQALLWMARHLSERGNARLTLITEGAYSVAGEPTNPAHCAVVGLARVVMTEMPELGLRILDVPCSGDLAPEALCEGILRLGEEESALRNGSWQGLRHQRVSPENEIRRAQRRAPREGEIYELYSKKPGDLNSLGYRPRSERPLAADFVEFEVQATALNFKDVMKAMGMLDETALYRTQAGAEFGLEAAGRVVRVGSAVLNFRPGDLISAFVGGSFSNRIQVRQEHAVLAARGHTAIEACTCLVFLTVWHGLVERAGIRQGERILIHSAAGGVGLAAIQLAQHYGAEIHATVGTEEKRNYLKSLGVQHIYDSRSLDFVEQVRAATLGEGVDLVLNSLAGEPLRRSFELLRAGGRFVEIGKQDISKGQSLPMLPFNAALSFIAVDMDRMALERPDLHSVTAHAVVRAFEAGIFRPLPTKVFKAEQVSEAFRALGSGAHIGKIVLDFSEGVGELASGMTPAVLFRNDCSYLVTGGLGGFGLKTGEWLIKGGAGRVVLAGRRGRPDPVDRAAIEALAASFDCHLEYRALDVTVEDEVTALISHLADAKMPLKGIFHSAMVLDDKPLRDLDVDSLSRVMLPKALGAYWLHRATLAVELDHFVLYSSVSALVGNPGQASYAAANAYLDGLASLRRSRGLPAVSVNWGALAEVGVVARDPSVEQHLKSIGLQPQSPERALVALGFALGEGHGNLGIIDIDWGRWMRSNPSTPWLRLELVASDNAQAGSLVTRLTAALLLMEEQAQKSHVLSLITENVAPIFRLAPADFDPVTPLKDYGLDSLLALEVQIAIEAAVGIELSSMEILAGRPLQNIASTCLERLLKSATAAESTQPAPESAATPRRLDALRGQADLTDYFLDRICVQRPYFALRNIESKEGWLTAIARPAPPSQGEHAAVSVAEAARHLAILGSCVCRLDIAVPDGRVYFPVKSSLMHGQHQLTRLPICEEVIVRARSLLVNEKLSLARARTELFTLDGQLICGFDVEYHVIFETEFQTLFAAHAQPTDEASGIDPYELAEEREGAVFDASQASLALGPVAAADCLGHFVGYPAYPVSIMLRDAIGLAVAVIEAENPGKRARFSVVGGSAQTERFIFAGQEATLRLTDRRQEGDLHLMRVEVHDAQSVAAHFDMSAEIEFVALSRQSDVVKKDGSAIDDAHVAEQGARRLSS